VAALLMSCKMPVRVAGKGLNGGLPKVNSSAVLGGSENRWKGDLSAGDMGFTESLRVTRQGPGRYGETHRGRESE